VKGYIQYYADMGVKYLRVDFLSWYQDGKNSNPDFDRPIIRDIKYYRTALKWMKEACDAN
jgi:aryl-phospho-beta-D-glucosidase BglC (GH1 family)